MIIVILNSDLPRFKNFERSKGISINFQRLLQWNVDKNDTMLYEPRRT